MNNLSRQWRHFVSYFLEGDQSVGLIRFLGALVAVCCAGLLGLAFEIREGFNPFSLEFLFKVFRYWPIPVAAMLFGLVAGVRYLQDIFEFKSFQKALGYLFASLFGVGYPWLTIRDGKTDPEKDDATNTLLSIGGPGYLDVRPGSVVLLERGAGPSNVYGAGRYFLRRFETMREVLDLRETYRLRENIDAVTKDGIKVSIRDVEATFRIDTGRHPQRTEMKPYPFSVKAVRHAVYNRAASKAGTLLDWGDQVMFIIGARIRQWVARQRLDRITAPLDEDPRAAIRAEFNAPLARRILGNWGAELVWLNIGHFDTPPEIDAQRIVSWQAFWQSHDKVTLAQGEALQTAYEELGRAEGQAEMLQAIARALEAASPNASLEDPEVVKLILLRIGQVLEGMTAQPGLSRVKTQTALQAAETPFKPPDTPSTPAQ